MTKFSNPLCKIGSQHTYLIMKKIMAITVVIERILLKIKGNYMACKT